MLTSSFASFGEQIRICLFKRSPEQCNIYKVNVYFFFPMEGIPFV